MKIPADTRVKHWFNPGRKSEDSFRPEGKLDVIGPRQNPERSWGTKDTLAARLFVGLSVGQVPTWSQDDVVSIVVETRKKQGAQAGRVVPGATRRVTSHRDGSVMVEDSVQVVIIDPRGCTQEDFTTEIEALAEVLATRLDQEEVVVEIQRNGLALETFGIKPKKTKRKRKP